MSIKGYCLDAPLTYQEKNNIYDECVGCLNRICITDDKEEVLTMIASLNYKIMLLGKNTFLEIDADNEGEVL